MASYLGSRALQGLGVLFGVSVLAFGLLFLAGDPTAAFAQPDWTPAQVEQFRKDMGFDRPWIEQYARFLGGAVRGDFGDSLRHRTPVFPLLLERFPATLELAAAAFFLSLAVGVPIGVLSAVRRGSAADQAAMGAALAAQAFPTFWLGLMLLLAFAVELRWFPTSGRGGLSHLVLPAVTLATYATARNARLVRASLLEVLGSEYVRTARAKGLAERVVTYRHALRNALAPVLTIVGLDIGAVFSGAVITETVFAWPGIGRLIVASVAGRDVPLVQGAVVLVAVSFVVANILVDLGYAVLDPRIRYR